MAMPAEAQTNSTIAADYRAKTPTSEKLFKRAAQKLPSGITHDGRHLDPYPLYATHGKGSRKWCADGHEYVDYFGGHGAMILGHSRPEVVEAVRKQVALGTHLGASHELEVRWAELVCRLIPCAEKVRFTSSGTEASHMVLRLARAFTGKQKVVRFTGHFHGWHDGVVPGGTSHFDGGTPVGILPNMIDQSIVMPADDPAPTVKLLEERGAEVDGLLREEQRLPKWTQGAIVSRVAQSVLTNVDALRKGGVDPALFHDVLGGRLFTGAVFNAYGAMVLNRAYEPAGFAREPHERAVFMPPTQRHIRDEPVHGHHQHWGINE